MAEFGATALSRTDTPALREVEDRRGPELSVVVPTLNEAQNVQPLYEAIAAALISIRWEMIIVDDDSRDETVAIARQIAEMDGRVRCLRRIGRRGLAGAVVEGILSSSAFAVAIIDADMQHDERLLPRMLLELRAGADIAIGSRHVAGGQAYGGFSRLRGWISDAAKRAAQRILGVAVSDPMSGFFAIRRDKADLIAPRLSTQGFKVLLDILVSAPEPLNVKEIGYSFRPRTRGQSKLDSAVIWEFLGLLVAKASGDRISVRFLAFGLVGLTGLVVHLAALNGLLHSASLGFNTAQMLAAFAAMTWNFALNNSFTYRDRRLTGLKWVRGLVSFWVICSIGALANVGVASWVYGAEPTWWLAGAAGALMGAVFNYAVTSTVTWRAA